jgi:voltage-gated potassium channel
MENKRLQLRRIIFDVDTPAARAFDVVLLILILASISILMLETVNDINPRWRAIFRRLDWTITGLFTIEYALRVWTIERRRQYVLSFYGLIDLFSILPSYLSIFITGAHALAIIRVLRLLRVFRILKLVQFMGEASKLRNALRTSARKILVFLFFVVIVSTFIGTLMFIIEGREHGVTSIPRSIYWAVVTLTTVGYGDIAPQTTLGQLLATILMITGYGVIAVPTGLVTAELVRSNYGAPDSGVVPKCNKCGNQNHLLGAVYCCLCGDALKPVIVDDSNNASE